MLPQDPPGVHWGIPYTRYVIAAIRQFACTNGTAHGMVAEETSGERRLMGGARSDGTEPCEMLGQLLETARVTALSEAGGRHCARDQPAARSHRHVRAGGRAHARQAVAHDRAVHRRDAPDPPAGARRKHEHPPHSRLVRPGQAAAQRLPGVGGDRRSAARIGLPGEPCSRALYGKSPEDAPVSIDRSGIQHVVFTLFRNACEACSAAADPVIDISVRKDRYAVETSVSDNGTGVRPELRRRLFQPFFTTKPRGTGLGLASCRAVVEAHAGSMGFEDRPGGGSRFWFRLPVVIAAAAECSDRPPGGGASLEGSA